MKHFAIILLLITLCSSCKSNSQTNGFEKFKNEINKESLNKIIANMPYPISDNIIADYKYHPYYEAFGNSGIRIQYSLSQENQSQFYANLKRYRLLKNNLLFAKDSSYVYTYNEQNVNIEIPGFDDEFEELSSFNLNDNQEVEIYLIENGKLANIYIEGGNKIYNYSIGLYHFKKSSMLIYWFLIY